MVNFMEQYYLHVISFLLFLLGAALHFSFFCCLYCRFTFQVFLFFARHSVGDAALKVPVLRVSFVACSAVGVWWIVVFGIWHSDHDVFVGFTLPFPFIVCGCKYESSFFPIHLVLSYIYPFCGLAG